MSLVLEHPGPKGGDDENGSITGVFLAFAEPTVDGRESDEDALVHAEKRLREIKDQILVQSKRNVELKRDMRALDSRIALLIQHRIAAKPQRVESEKPPPEAEDHYPDERRLQRYSNLFFLLQSEPRHISVLCRLSSLSEIDALLHMVMFTLYGNQTDTRQELLLLTTVRSVLSAQVDSATSLNSILRPNTLASRVLITYTRRESGRRYLTNTLAERIRSLVEHVDLDLEIDPQKIHHQLASEVEKEIGQRPADMPRDVSADAAAKHPDVQAVLIPRLNLLLDIARSFLLTVLDSLDNVPYGIRWICKQIRILARTKYPDATDNAISSLVGSFFLLRFIIPPIVAPQAYMLVQTLPPRRPRRTLSLVAKALQNLVSRSPYTNEGYMSQLDPFVAENQAVVDSFFHRLCDVNDFDDDLEVEQYMAFAEKDVVMSLSLNELYDMHSLVSQHIATLAPNVNEPLRILVRELGPAPTSVPQESNISIELKLHNRWETIIPENTERSALPTKASAVSDDLVYIRTKSFFIRLLQSIPFAAQTPPYDLADIAELAATANDRALVQEGLEATRMLRVLSSHLQWLYPSIVPLLQEDVAAEITAVRTLRKQYIAREAVYNALRAHNDSLEAQIRQYQAYLLNARVSASKKKNSTMGVGVLPLSGKWPGRTPTKSVDLGSYRFTHAQLMAEGIILESNIPESQRPIVYLKILPRSAACGISLHYTGRENAFVEREFELAELVEMHDAGKHELNLEYGVIQYAKLDATKLFGLLRRLLSTRQ
uniref:RasGAP protein n=1 Tax=Mycena chlorophos TaxID=658473 RepID=A0ABQ0L0F1_MYCCL|nr:RasGAP protein [Mycena chlorophos]